MLLFSLLCHKQEKQDNQRFQILTIDLSSNVTFADGLNHKIRTADGLSVHASHADGLSAAGLYDYASTLLLAYHTMLAHMLLPQIDKQTDKQSDGQTYGPTYNIFSLPCKSLGNIKGHKFHLT